jgi:hypothetical protein
LPRFSVALGVSEYRTPRKNRNAEIYAKASHETRRWRNLDDQGRYYLYREKWRFQETDFAVELVRLEAALAELGATLESAYDEAYIERKRRALQKAGMLHERIEIEPKDWSIN